MDEAIAVRVIAAFARGTGPGLLRLGGGEVGQALPPVFGWWRSFAVRYVAALCVQAPAGEQTGATILSVPPPQAELATLVLTAPMMAGAGRYCSNEQIRLTSRACGRGADAPPTGRREKQRSQS